MKNKYLRILNKRVFAENRKMLLKNWITLSILLSLTSLFLFFVVSLSSSGFRDMDILWRTNYKLLIIIPIAGAGLGIGSFLIQQISNNRLGDTSVLGIGNVNLIALTILILTVDFSSSYSVSNYKKFYPFVFIVVSMFTSLCIYLLSYNKRENISKKFIISGIVLNFAFVSISYALNIFLSGGKAASIKVFASGFLDTAEPLSIYVSLGGFAFALLWLALIYEKFRICTISNEIARELGIRTNIIYLQVLLIAGLLTGVSYTLVGNVAFLGMLAANISYNLFKKNFNFGIPGVSLAGTLILAVAFVFNKNILNTNINTTALIPLVGIPYFLYLVIKE